MVTTYADKISIVIVIVFSILGILAYVGIFNPVYDFVGWSSQGPIIIDYPDFPSGKQTIHFITSSMSAQNPIKVVATIKLDETTVTQNFTDNYLSGKEKIFLVFPRSYPAYSLFPEYARGTPFIPLEPSSDHSELKGEFIMKYPFSGTYDYVYFTSEDKIKYKTENGGWNLSKANYRSVNDTIKIESASITSNLQTNNIFLTLTIVAIAFGSIEIIQKRFKS